MASGSEKSTVVLISDALDDLLSLMRKELELVKIGVVEGLTGRLKGAGLIAGALLAILPGLLFLSIAIALWLPGSPATGFAILGLFLLAIAGAGIAVGVKLVKSGGGDGADALNQVKEDVRWARKRLTR